MEDELMQAKKDRSGESEHFSMAFTKVD